jgi:hypothetical protein
LYVYGDDGEYFFDSDFVDQETLQNFIDGELGAAGTAAAYGDEEAMDFVAGGEFVGDLEYVKSQNEGKLKELRIRIENVIEHVNLTIWRFRSMS